jgi:two-component system, LytTR family, sensor kinase
VFLARPKTIMPDRLSIHAPVLVNTIGHCAGAMVFGILFYLLLLDWRRGTKENSLLPALAAALALLWNLGSLIGMATAPQGEPIADAIVATSFSVLSFLPAVLLHISVKARHPFLWICGYVISTAAALLHICDLVTGAARFHYAAILVITIGFGALTLISVVRETLRKSADGAGARLAGAMVLFLFAISFVHLGSSHDVKGWSGEAALHHAGIPLALFVLLQDYRFLLLDAFLRFLLSGTVAALAVWTALQIEARAGLLSLARRDPFYAGIIFIGACCALILFTVLRNRGQRFLTRVVFQRRNPEYAATRLAEVAAGAADEHACLAASAHLIADFFSARRFDLISERDLGSGPPPPAVFRAAGWGLPPWLEIVAPLRFVRGDVHLFGLGSRAGGRRYLSEDIEALERLCALTCEHVERIRNIEMQSLVSQAELRSLQAQINPHFLFNALNTLYGTIARENIAARKLVLNLSGLFRYSFVQNRDRIPIAEELEIVRAYLQIEELRLGSRLRYEVDVDPDVLETEVPVLSIQPLVENAIKHGVAAHASPGFVRLSIKKRAEAVNVEISNSGEFQGPREAGVGLANVRRRLALCYGTESDLEILNPEGVTIVRFALPAAHSTVRSRMTQKVPFAMK